MIIQGTKSTLSPVFMWCFPFFWSVLPRVDPLRLERTEGDGTYATHFFDVATTFVGSIYVIFTLFGYRVWGEGEGRRDWYTTCLCSFLAWDAQESNELCVVILLPSANQPHIDSNHTDQKHGKSHTITT